MQLEFLDIQKADDRSSMSDLINFVYFLYSFYIVCMHIQKAYKGRFCQLVVQVLYIPFVATLICSRLYVASLYGTVCSYIDMQLASKLAAKNIHLNFEFHKPFLVGLFSLNFAATGFVQILLFLYVCRNLMPICCSQLAAFIILSYKILICITSQLATVFLYISKYKIYIYKFSVLCNFCRYMFCILYIASHSQRASQVVSFCTIFLVRVSCCQFDLCLK